MRRGVPVSDFDTSLAHIRARLAAFRPAAPETGPGTRHAAVAAVLRPGPRDTEVLLIRRAERPGDPWSGHMAFPGGHRDPGDPHLMHTAKRETAEEVGLRLPDGAVLGALEPIRANPRGRPIDMLVTPYVFAVEATGPLRPNHEVAGTVWAPLGAFVRGEDLTEVEWRPEGRTLRLPGYRTPEGVVWGMTYRMLHGLFTALYPHWEPQAQVPR